MNINNINLLIISSDMKVGGVQTLILRICKYFFEYGKRVKVILYSRGNEEMYKKLEEYAEIKIITFKQLLLMIFVNSNPFLKNTFFSDINQILNVYPGGNILSCFLSLKLQIFLKTAVYHPDDYFFTTRWEKNLFNSIPDECKLFMNDETKKGTEKHLGKIINGIIWPLAVIDNSNNMEFQNIIPQKNKIISVGNLMGFKTYNLTMLKVIKELKDQGISLIYEIWGTGFLEKSMKEYIMENSLAENIFIRGTLPYSLFYSQVKTAYIFIGLGTAAIEASYAGVPTIIATGYSKEPISNGLFTDIEGYNIGEFNPDIHTVKIVDLIKKILVLNKTEYNLLIQKHIAISIQKYNMKQVLNKFEQLPNINIAQNFKFKCRIKIGVLAFLLRMGKLNARKKINPIIYSLRRQINYKNTIY